MTPPVTNMDQKVVTMPQVEQAAPPVRSKRRGVWVAVGVVLAALIIGAAVLGAVALHKSGRHDETFDLGMAYRHHQVVPQQVTVDNQRQIIYIQEQRVGSLGGLSYLRNYEKMLSAIRDEANKRCYLTSIEGTYQEMAEWYSKVNGTSNAVQPRHYHMTVQPMDEDAVRILAGEEIALHCRGLPTHWIQKKTNEECSSSPTSNSTVAFHCDDGEVFDHVTFTCRPSGGQLGQRLKRAVAAASLELAECCCCCCCCCCKKGTE